DSLVGKAPVVDGFNSNAQQREERLGALPPRRSRMPHATSLAEVQRRVYTVSAAPSWSTGADAASGPAGAASGRRVMPRARPRRVAPTARMVPLHPSTGTTATTSEGSPR